MILKGGVALVVVALLSALTGCASVSLEDDVVVCRWVSIDAHSFVLNFAENGDYSADGIPRLLLSTGTPIDEVDWQDRLDLSETWKLREPDSVMVDAMHFGTDYLYLQRDKSDLKLRVYHDVEAPWNGYCFVKDAGTP